MVLPAIVGESCQEKRSCTTAQSAMTNPQLSQLSLNINCRKSSNPCHSDMHESHNWIELDEIWLKVRVGNWIQKKLRNDNPPTVATLSYKLKKKHLVLCSPSPQIFTIVTWMRATIPNWIEWDLKLKIESRRRERRVWGDAGFRDVSGRKTLHASRQAGRWGTSWTSLLDSSPRHPGICKCICLCILNCICICALTNTQTHCIVTITGGRTARRCSSASA